MNHSISFFAAILTLFFFGCGTIFNGSNQEINIISDPIEAKIFLDDKEIGNTPMTAELSRKENHIVRIELENYETKIITVNRKTSNWFIGNCLFGGLIGMGIDALSGGMYRLEPEEINETLSDSDVISMKNKDAIFIKVVLMPDPEWEKIGQFERLTD